MSVTVVTCFFDTTRFRSGERGKTGEYWKPEVYKTKNPMVIFGDSKYIEYAKSQRVNRLTEYYTMTMEQMELWQYNGIINKNREVSWPSKDDRCPTSVHIICCSKILFFRDVINSNPFKTDKFCFVDCNALGKSKATYKDLDERLDRITDKFHFMVIGVPNKNLPYNELYKQYQYILFGGIFASGRDNGLFMADRFLEEFKKVTDAGFGHGEEMIWIKILYDHFDRLELSYGDYSEAVTNFLEPLDNHNYIFNYIIKMYAGKGYYRELEACCRKMLGVKLSSDIHLNALYYLYIACFYLGNNDGIINTINSMIGLINNDDECRNIYLGNREFYKNNGEYIKHLYNGINPLDVNFVGKNLFGVAIPCYKPHLKKLTRLLDSIENQTVKPTRVVISSSETNAPDVVHLDKKYSFDVTFILHNDIKTHSQNRNIASKLLTGLGFEYVSFMDADDVMHPQRCEFILKEIGRAHV